MKKMREEWKGTEVIPRLADIYRQLYLRPEEGAEEAYRDIVLRGNEPKEKNLSHFITSPGDSCVWEETPAGPVRVVTLRERADFETFLQIMANRCVPTEIHPTQGASILDGVINRRKIEAHQEAFIRQAAERGELLPDWAAEFKRFTSDKRNYTEALIILSAGPYSGIAAGEMGMEEAEWLERSYMIRKAHECTHFLCRRRYPEKIDPIWDELVADAVGLYAAFGRYDPETAERFLGIRDGVYRDGRLQIYAGPEERDALAGRIHGTLPEIRKECETLGENEAPYELAVRLEERKEELWPAGGQKNCE